MTGTVRDLDTPVPGHVTDDRAVRVGTDGDGGA